MTFEDLRRGMDAQVSSDLGDSISITFNGAGAPVTKMGFVWASVPEGSVQGLDAIMLQWHVKIDMAEIPGKSPADIARLSSAKLPAVYKPAVDTIDSEGVSWVFDIQRAPGG